MGLLFTPPLLVIALRGRTMASRPGINHDKECVRNVEMIFMYTRWWKSLQFDDTKQPFRVGIRQKGERADERDMAFYVIHPKTRYC